MDDDGRYRQVWGWVFCVLVMIGVGCHQQVVTVYWSKPGAGNADLQKDKDQCQSLQRAANLDEERISKCLEAQGWSPVREEIESDVPSVPVVGGEE